jgi:hypothetical protein
MEEPVKQESELEVMKTPEISVESEEGAQLLSIILKAENPEWGESTNKISEETNKYFQKNPLSDEISSLIEEIRELQSGRMNKEALYCLALTYNHPERNVEALNFIKEHKSFIIKDPEKLQQKIFEAIDYAKQILSNSELKEQFAKEEEQDKKDRLENLEETKTRIEKLIEFFKPNSETTKIRRVSLMPTDPLFRKSTGTAFVFGEELVLKTHIDNPNNLEHEFSHSVINPIVDKLFGHLNQEQRGKITELANEKLRQDYGDGCYSLLCEEFIRTYNDVFKTGRKPETLEDFQTKIASLSEDKFQDLLLQSENLKVRCNELEIKTIEDLKNKAQEYFERFEKNQLRDIIFEFYQEYVNRLDKNTNFEKFVLNNFANKIQI